MVGLKAVAMADKVVVMKAVQMGHMRVGEMEQKWGLMRVEMLVQWWVGHWEFLMVASREPWKGYASVALRGLLLENC